jgi:hypothetical protein
VFIAICSTAASASTYEDVGPFAPLQHMTFDAQALATPPTPNRDVQTGCVLAAQAAAGLAQGMIIDTLHLSIGL